MIEAYAEVQKVFKSRCCEQADKLERMEGEMATQAKAMGLLQVDYDKLKVEVSRLRVEKEKKTLINDMAGTFEEGFKEALAQAVCENPGIDVSNCDSTHHIVDGKVGPWRWMSELPPSTATILLYTLHLFLTLFDKLVIL